MADLLERTKSHTFKEFTIFKGVIEWAIEGVKQRYCILDQLHWNSFYSSMRDLLGDATNAILRKIGEDFGQKVFSIVREKYGADKITAFKFILQNLEKLGWGAFWNIKISEDQGTIVLELHNTNEGYNEGKASCYHISGILCGLAKGLLGDDILVREVKCSAKGDKICEFHIGREEVVPALYEKDILDQLKQILQDLKHTIKSRIELVATTDGVPIVSTGLPSELDSSLWGTIISFILAGGMSGSQTIANGSLKEVIINAEKGTIIASQCTKDTILIAVIAPDTSPGLAGLALKKAKEKIIQLL
ncbi:MAG: V4R domain-containing protein [Candidatus Helarchaeota archaeon]